MTTKEEINRKIMLKKQAQQLIREESISKIEKLNKEIAELRKELNNGR